jgi:outer membrane protein assembly factor BamC
MDQRSIVQRGLFCALALSGVAGCSSISSMTEPNRIDYQSAAKAAHAPTLDVPPDLTQLQRDNRYQVPEAGNGIATLLQYNSKQPGPVAAASTVTVAANAIAGMHIERDGNQRWLVVKQSPEALWPQLKDFWQESGFLINVDKPAIGVMETDWTENRSKIPSDIVHETLGKVLDSLWSTGERDKYRTRVERAADGSTEVYISHRGAQEVAFGAQKDSTMWEPRPSDPGLEAEFLSRLMARLGNDPSIAKTAIANSTAEPAHSKLVKGADGSYVEVDEGFDHAWRRVGLALDRVGFTVEDRDRTQGLYFVRYVDEGKDAQSTAEKGFFSKLMFWNSSDTVPNALKYRISIKETGAGSKIVVLDNDGKPELSGTGEKILNLLNDQLK